MPHLPAALTAAARAALGLRPEGGWGRWDDQAFAAEALCAHTARLAAALAIAARETGPG